MVDLRVIGWCIALIGWLVFISSTDKFLGLVIVLTGVEFLIVALERRK